MTLDDLIARCKGSVRLEINPHRDVYMTARDWRAEQYAGPWQDCDPIDATVDPTSIVVLQFYPDTPIGFYLVVANTLDSALRCAAECLRKPRTVNPGV
jgi:hypothetical protein